MALFGTGLVVTVVLVAVVLAEAFGFAAGLDVACLGSGLAVEFANFAAGFADAAFARGSGFVCTGFNLEADRVGFAFAVAVFSFTDFVAGAGFASGFFGAALAVGAAFFGLLVDFAARLLVKSGAEGLAAAFVTGFFVVAVGAKAAQIAWFMA